MTCKWASCRNGVQFFIFHLASWLRTRRFSEPTFRPSGATKHWKNTVFRSFPTVSRSCIFSLLTFSISYLLPSGFLPVRVSSWLRFSSFHIGGALVSKLPWTKNLFRGEELAATTRLAIKLQAQRTRFDCFWYFVLRISTTNPFLVVVVVV